MYVMYINNNELQIKLHLLILINNLILIRR